MSVFTNTFFAELYRTPSIDSSAFFEEQASDMKELIDQNNEALAMKLSNLLLDYGFSVTVSADNVVSATKSNLSAMMLRSKYQMINTGGILTLREIVTKNKVDDFKPKSKIRELLSDESDSEDYANRYTSLDAKEYRQDGSDIAFIRIVENNDYKDPVFPNFDKAPSPGITRNRFKQFILTQISVAHQERMQIVETNKDYQVLFFGRKPEILQIGGVLKNTIDNPWSVNMIFLWDELMRGTVLATKGYICQLYVDGELFEGYPFNFQRSKVAGQDNLVNFSFSFLIKERMMVNNTNNLTTDVYNANN